MHDKEEFKKRLRADRRDLQILWSFTHGHSGDVIAEVKTQVGTAVVNATEIAGQRLDFSFTESITAHEIELETIQDEEKDEEPQFFTRRRFVFLNGCETGTEGTRGMTELKTDVIDVEMLLRTLMAGLRGEPRVCSMVPIPNEAVRKRGGRIGNARI